ERSPAVSLWLGRWSKPVSLDPFRMTVEQTPDGASLLGWPDALAGADRERSALLLLADPFTFPVDAFLAEANANYGGLRVLGGMAPLQQLQGLWPTLDAREQRLLQERLHVGRVINEYQGEFQRGDFLVRNVLGVDPDSGAVAINDRVRVGQTVQFHVRDA